MMTTAFQQCGWSPFTSVDYAHGLYLTICCIDARGTGVPRMVKPLWEQHLTPMMHASAAGV